jgi:hypothetical protein
MITDFSEQFRSETSSKRSTSSALSSIDELRKMGVEVGEDSK